MNAKRRVFFLILVIACIAAGFCASRTSVSNPTYQGKRLSEWLRGYETDYGSIQWNATDEAVRHLGTNAIPFLLKERWASDSELKRKVSYWMYRHLKIRYTPAERRQKSARYGMLALRPRANEVVPVLMKIYGETAKRGDQSSLSVLSAIGDFERLAGSAVPLLLRETGSTNVYVRREAFWVLTRTRSNPELVIPAFIRGLSDYDITVREKAAWGLEGCGGAAESALPALRESLDQVKSRESEFKTDNNAHARYQSTLVALTAALQWINEASNPEPVVHSLIDALHNSDYYGRMSAAEKLGRFGADAKEAVPKLVEMRDQEKRMLQQAPNSLDRKRMYAAVTDALSKINGTITLEK